MRTHVLSYSPASSYVRMQPHRWSQPTHFTARSRWKHTDAHALNICDHCSKRARLLSGTESRPTRMSASSSSCRRCCNRLPANEPATRCSYTARLFESRCTRCLASQQTSSTCTSALTTSVHPPLWIFSSCTTAHRLLDPGLGYQQAPHPAPSAPSAPSAPIDLSPLYTPSAPSAQRDLEASS